MDVYCHSLITPSIYKYKKSEKKRKWFTKHDQKMTLNIKWTYPNTMTLDPAFL